MSHRDALIARARELGVFDDPENRTDQQLRDAIDAEEACIGWFAKYDRLPTPEAQAAALRRLVGDFPTAARIRDNIARGEAQVAAGETTPLEDIE